MLNYYVTVDYNLIDGGVKFLNRSKDEDVKNIKVYKQLYNLSQTINNFINGPTEDAKILALRGFKNSLGK